MKKRITALLLAGVMMLSLCACGGGQADVTGEAANDPLTKDDVITMLVPSNASWPYREDWKLWEYMSEGSGATLEVSSLPSSDAVTKWSLMFAGRDTLPDIMAFSMGSDALKYAGEGLIALEDLEAYMPVYNAWKNSLSEDEYEIIIKNRITADGKIYYTPATGREGKTRMRGWLYREDIFKKHDLKAPETFDELYEVSKKLKELYPNSYPFSTRSMSYVFDIIGSSFDKWWEYDAYYDHDDEEWRWGATEDTALEVVSFYNKMISEKLAPADMVTMNNNSFEELVLTDRTFIMPHLQLRIDYFNNLAKDKNPEFKVQAFVPPVANAEKGVAMIERGDVETMGLSVCDTGKAEGIANAAKFIDWMYTDEGMELLSWGKEGETYEVVDGKKKFITDENGSAPNALYGFQLYGSFTRLDPLAAEAMQTETTLETEAMLREHTLPYYPVTMWLDFNDDEQMIIDTYNTGLKTYTQEMLMKFMLGQEPLSSFDTFRKTLEEMNVADVLAAYESAYNRVK